MSRDEQGEMESRECEALEKPRIAIWKRSEPASTVGSSDCPSALDCKRPF